MPNSRDLLRSKDVAYILDCSPDDAMALARRGKIKAVKRGRFWRYSPKSVIEYKRKNGNGH